MTTEITTITDLILVDTSLNPGSLVLPNASQINGRTITIKDKKGTCDINKVLINAAPGDMFENAKTQISLETKYGFIKLIAAKNIWYIGATTQPYMLTANSIITNITKTFSYTTSNIQLSSFTLQDSVPGYNGKNQTRTLYASNNQTLYWDYLEINNIYIPYLKNIVIYKAGAAPATITNLTKDINGSLHISWTLPDTTGPGIYHDRTIDNTFITFYNIGTNIEASRVISDFTNVTPTTYTVTLPMFYYNNISHPLVFNTLYTVYIITSNLGAIVNTFNNQLCNILYGIAPINKVTNVTIATGQTISFVTTWTLPTAVPMYAPIDTYYVKLCNSLGIIEEASIANINVSYSAAVNINNYMINITPDRYTTYVYSSNAIGLGVSNYNPSPVQYGTVPPGPLSDISIFEYITNPSQVSQNASIDAANQSNIAKAAAEDSSSKLTAINNYYSAMQTATATSVLKTNLNSIKTSITNIITDISNTIIASGVATVDVGTALYATDPTDQYYLSAKNSLESIPAYLTTSQTSLSQALDILFGINQTYSIYLNNPPVEPTQVQITEIGTTSIALQWLEGQYAFSYTVYIYYNINGKESALIATIPGVEHSPQTLETILFPGRFYAVTIQSDNLYGSSSPSLISQSRYLAVVTNATYTTPGSYQFTMPVGYNAINITALAGASGGTGFSGANYGGYRVAGGIGALVSGILYVTPGETITILVGGAGGEGMQYGAGAGGYGGGGSGAFGGAGGAGGAGGGGGRSAIQNASGIVDLISAGGGAGAGIYTGGNGGNGGINGASGLGSLDVSARGGGAIGSTPGLGGFFSIYIKGYDGNGHQGGSGGDATNSTAAAGGGGGGGYAGGGGGCFAGGGGGSSYISSTLITDANVIDGGASIGNGYVTFSLYNVLPSPPTTVLVTEITATSISVSWSGAIYATTYNVYIYYNTSLAVIADNAHKVGSTISGVTSSPQTFSISPQNMYYYAVIIESININGYSPSLLSNTIRYIVQPVAATNVNITSITNISISVSWSGDSTATSYTIRMYSDTNSSPTTLLGTPISNIQSSPYTLTITAQNGYYYIISVESVNINGLTAIEKKSSAVQYLIHPVAPTQPSVTFVTSAIINSVTNTQISVNWSGAQHADSYTIYIYSDLNSPPTTLIGTFTGLSASPQTVSIVGEPTANNYYAAVVESVNVNGLTAASIESGAILYNVLVAPTIISITFITSGSTQITVNWSGDQNATSYTIRIYSDTNSTPTTLIGTFTGLSASPQTVSIVGAPIVNNYYAVSIQVDHLLIGPSALSESSTAIQYVPPAVATNVNISYDAQGISVNWTGDSTATSYTVYIYTDIISDVTTSSTLVGPITGITDTSYLFQGIPGNYYAAAVESDNISFGPPAVSELSNIIQYVVYPTAPTSVTITAITPTDITVAWSGDQNATTYTIRIYSDPDPNQAILIETYVDLGGTPQTVTISLGTIVNNYYIASVESDNALLTDIANSYSSSPVQYTPPVAADSVTVISVTDIDISVDWSGDQYATSYTIRIYSDTNSTPTTSSTLVETFPNLGGPYQTVSITTIPGYYYAATVESDNSISSPVAVSQISLGTQYYVLPVAPTSVTITAITPTDLTVEWSGDQYATSYTIRIYSDTDPNPTTLVGTPFSGLGASPQTITITTVSDNYYIVSVESDNLIISDSANSYSSSSVFYTPPAAQVIQYLRIIDINTTDIDITITWSEDLNATSYTIYVYSDTTSSVNTTTSSLVGTFPNLTTTPLTQTFTITNAINGQYYAVTVESSNIVFGPPAVSNISSALQYTAPPQQPTITSVTVNPSGVTVTWSDTDTSITSYNVTIYSSTSDQMDNPSPVSGQSPSTTAALTSPQLFTFTLTNGLYYGAIVTANNASGFPVSSSISSGSLYTAPPTAPTSISINTFTSSGATVTWSSDGSATSYTVAIYYSLNINMSGAHHVDQTPTLSDTTVSSGQVFAFTTVSLYYYAVIVNAINAGGSVASANPTSGTRYIAPPTAPIATMGAVSGSGATISWSDDATATSWTVTIYSSSASNMSSPSTVTQDPLSSDTTVTPGQSFTFTLTNGIYYGAIVTAYNGSGVPVSSLITAGVLYTAPPTAATSVTVTNLTSSEITVSWYGETGATSYTITVYSDITASVTTSSTPVQVFTTGITSSPKTLSITPTPGRYYAFVVRSINIADHADSSISAGIQYTASVVYTYTTPGTVTPAITVPAGYNVMNIISLAGASGGNSGPQYNTVLGGVGALVSGQLSVTAGTSIIILVGGAGVGGNGGAGGGGNGARPLDVFGGSGGGGRSAILSDIGIDLVSAGGGGGASYNTDSTGGYGGLNGGNGTPGRSGGDMLGGLGAIGNGVTTGNTSHVGTAGYTYSYLACGGGGGGGGYAGGKGGGGNTSGGGGSSDISLLRGANIINGGATRGNGYVTFTFGTVPLPTAPTTVTITNMTYSVITVNWSGDFGATSYTLKLYSDINPNPDPLNTETTRLVGTFSGLTGSPQTLSFTSALSGFYYAAVITSVNFLGSSDSSISSDYHFTLAAIAPTSMTITSLVASSSSFTVSWSGDHGASSYIFYVFLGYGPDTGPNNYAQLFYIDNIDGPSPQTVSISDPLYDGAYYVVAVQSIAANGSYNFSTNSSQSIQYMVVPTGVTISFTSQGAVVTWSGSAVAVSYSVKIYYSSSSSVTTSSSQVTGSPFNVVSSGSIIVFTIPSGINYFAVSVTEYNADGFTVTSELSSVVGPVVSYSTPGSYDYQIPAGYNGINIIALRGASGGGNSANGVHTSFGGIGALVSGILAISAGTTITILVGGVGGSVTYYSGAGVGGFGGGGTGSSANYGGAGGGGRSAIQNKLTALDIVSAGGGGGSSLAGKGGDGGTNGGNGLYISSYSDSYGRGAISNTPGQAAPGYYGNGFAGLGHLGGRGGYYPYGGSGGGGGGYAAGGGGSTGASGGGGSSDTSQLTNATIIDGGAPPGNGSIVFTLTNI